MKQWLMAGVLSLLSFHVLADDMIHNDDPHALLEEVADKTFQRIAADRDKIEADPNYLKTVVKQELMPYVDAIYASKKVLGRNYKDTTEAQRQEFYQVFEDYLVATYARAFTQYNEEKQEVVFEEPQPLRDNARVATVRTLVKQQGRPDIHLDFKIRYDDDSKLWKAYDLVVEGISLLNSKAAEIAAVIRSRGIDGTIDLLREKAEEPIVMEQGQS